MPRSISCALLCALLAACNVISGASELSVGDRLGVSDAGTVSAMTCPAAGYRCVAAAPAGFSGPFSLTDADCDEGLVERLRAHLGDPRGEASCSECGCAAPTDVSCEVTVDQFYSYGPASCGPTPKMSSVVSTACVPTTSPLAFATARTTPTAGSCKAVGGTLTKVEPTWDVMLVGCGAAAVGTIGCARGEVCAPEIAGCISRPGEHACPAPYTERTLAFAGTDDTRSCSACACSPPIGATCAATIDWWSTKDCSGAPKSVEAPLDCTNVSAGSLMLQGSPVVTAGACSVQGEATPTVTGALVSSEPVTICCLSGGQPGVR